MIEITPEMTGDFGISLANALIGAELLRRNILQTHNS